MKSEAVETVSLDNRIAVVTGTGGLGLEAAIALARSGAQIVLAGRNKAKGDQAIADIKAAVPGARARFAQVDLANLDSVAAFATALESELPQIDILINNAGIMSPPQRRTTREGCELQFGVNYLGHFALTARLLPLLRKSAGARVVNVTSLAHRVRPLDFDDLQSEKKYQAGLAYCQSKLAQAVHAVELQKRSDLGGWGITSVAVHPGFARTNLFRSEDTSQSFLGSIGTGLIGAILGHSAANGAASLVYAATSPDAKGGELVGPTGLFEMSGRPGSCKLASWASDPEAGSKLWRISEELAGVHFPAVP